MNWYDHIYIWSHASVKLQDIQKIKLPLMQETVYCCTLSKSAFIFFANGEAVTNLGGMEFVCQPFSVLHGGKGEQLMLTASKQLEFYVIYYKASLPFLSSRKTMRLAESIKPFQIIYSCMPDEPIILYETVKRMACAWDSNDQLDKIQATSLFYSFIHNIFRQLRAQGNVSVQPNIVVQAVRYIQQYYTEPLNIDIIAESLQCSANSLSRLFKKQLGISPIEYLIQTRIAAAKQLLCETDARLQYIAVGVGYSDVYYFSRIFKKQTGSSPQAFRIANKANTDVQNNPLTHTKLSIAPETTLLYSFDENNYHYQRGEVLEVNKVKKTSKMAIMLLGASLMLAACQSAAPGNAPSASAPAQTVVESDTITYTASNGDITFPRNPERVVDISDTYVGHLLALGIKPIGVRTWALDNPYIKEELDGVTDLGDGTNIEAIMDLEPDLITAYRADVYQTNIVEQLEKVAPTAAVAAEDDMRMILLEFGKMLDKESDAKEWISQWDALIAENKPIAKEIVGEGKVLIMQPYDKGIYVFGSGAARGGDILYKEFGLSPTDDVQQFIDKGEIYVNYSLELLATTDADFIFVMTGASNEEAVAELYASPLWSQIPAVKNNRVYEADSDGFSFNDPISIGKQLDIIMENLTGQQ